jgi:fatty-acyl-CoA synthase
MLSPFPLTAPRVVRTLVDVEQIEATPWQASIPAQDTYHLLRSAYMRWPERIALRLLLAGDASAPTRDLSYGELLEGVHRTANALHALGVEPGAAVSILLPNLIEGHLALWGSQAAGIASPINPMLDASYIARIVSETRSQVIVAFGPDAGSDIWEKAVAVADQVDSVHTLLQVDPAAALGLRQPGVGHEPRGARPTRAGVQVLDFHDALEQADPIRLTGKRRFDPNDPCAYFHTGGTTGYPKVAVHSHRNEAFIAWALQSFFERQHEVLLAGLPLFHVNGAIVTGLSAFHRGAEVVMLTPGGYRTPGVLDNFWAIVRRFGAASFSAVPTVLASLAGKPLPEGGVPSLRHVLCGAAPLPAQVALAFEKTTGVRIHEGYGLTEGSCVSTVNPPAGDRRLGSAGIRVPYQELRVFRVGATGRPDGYAAPGEVGVIGIRGPNVFPGYLRESDNRHIWIDGGWFDTGDLGRTDDEGYLTLLGRAKDLIIRGGHNIDPSMIEETLARHPAVAMVAAIGQPDRHAGELPVAYLTVKPGMQTSAAELLDFARTSIPERAAVPVRVEVLPALPLTAVGKLAKPELRRLAIEHVLHEALAKAGLHAVRAKARHCPQQGLVVDLSGPVDVRDDALELAGLYPVARNWLEARA